jgi:putative holliday junction resolvase
MRTLGIDFGTKTIGLAVSDATGLISHGIGIVSCKNLKHDLRELQKKIEEYEVKKIVVGLPKNMDGSLGKSAQQVLVFVEKLKNRFALPVDTWDERLSTVEAERVLIHADTSRSKRKKVIDKVAATIILQGYLDYTNRNLS